ncbi:DinB family protein [Brevibacillus sp. H7]|uniref:DinB family protein n=1 Tax=Brevibacillus sp. H7 TaxID=3349138 RepID=UPI00381584A1
MREAFLFGMFEKTREQWLKKLETCPEDKRTVIPAGFNNHLHWQIGHILFVTDGLIYGLSGNEMRLPASYRTFFGNKTKPSEWTGEAPSWEEILAHLKQQPEHIRAAFGEKLDAPVKDNFLNAQTVGELLMANIVHESNHAGTISAMLKALH